MEREAQQGIVKEAGRVVRAKIGNLRNDGGCKGGEKKAIK